MDIEKMEIVNEHKKLLRNLKTSDIYPMSKILKKLNLRLETTEINDVGEKVMKTQTQLGVEMILAMFENLYMAENEVNAFFGGMVGISGEQFGELPIEESLEIIKQFKELPNLSNFFKLAGQLKR